MEPKTFVEEIDFKEIELDKVVGKGTFGLVRKGRWRNVDVAVKQMETEQEKNAFFTEVRQLSRVSHPNIVKLYGACTKTPVCLVMEYAEGGSLYNVLHCSPGVEYTAAHAISWVLQCARGVAYLHNMKPKALIHRDLKPPNLLLIMGGTVLKICDFGTACDMQTFMTNNKGSAAWMAPEVFESSNYSEKCDVFSWGIILWEVLTRRKPFDDIGGPAFRIMWAVHSGQRPPLIENCPKPLEVLMTRCWSKDPKERLSMSEVEEHLEHLFPFFKKGANIPIISPPTDVYGTADDDSLESQKIDNLSELENSYSSQQRHETNESPQKYLPPTSVAPVIPPRPRTSAPASLSNSQENLIIPSRENKIDINKRRSMDFTGLEVQSPHIPSHRRTGSYGSTIVKDISSVVPNNSPIQTPLVHKTSWPSPSYIQDPINSNQELPRKGSWPHSPGVRYSNEDLSDWNAYLLLEPRLQPLPPAPSSRESIEIFDSHRKMANEYLHIQTEVCLLTQRKNELEISLQEDQQKTSTYIEEYIRLKSEKDNLLKLQQNLKRQIELIKAQQQRRSRDNSGSHKDDWVLVENNAY